MENTKNASTAWRTTFGRSNYLGNWKSKALEAEVRSGTSTKAGTRGFLAEKEDAARVRQGKREVGEGR